MKTQYTFPAHCYFDNDGISIEFPDLPGCLPCAHNQDEALRNAKEALSLHLYGMVRDGDPIPEPTPVSQLKPKIGGVVILIDWILPTVRDPQKNVPIRHTLRPICICEFPARRSNARAGLQKVIVP